MNSKVNFVDILEPRRTQSGILSFMTRAWRPQKSVVMKKYFTPQELKEIAANSVYLDSIVEAESTRLGVRKEKLKRQIWEYLEEIGLDKKMHIIRWMGIFFLKMSFLMKVEIYVNEPAILKLKSSMGRNPVFFLPTHRSYADFCIMTYLCYHYDIDLPAVAAGVDFYNMAIMGRSMRDTCGFYIRRSLNGAPLYAATLKHYVRTLVAKHCAPIEFFLEGTRCRSNKSMPPKYGLLSMSLLPFFAREVSDVTIVPINMSYDRVVEHSLFAYEHLGVPKPKETTGALLRAIRSLNDHYGNIYINFGEPFSVREFLKAEPLISEETLKPLDLQQLTDDQFKKVQDVANHVIHSQQESTVATISNLLALVLMQSLVKSRLLSKEEVVQEVEYMIQVLKNLGATVFENDVEASVERILVVHRSMMRLDKEKRLRLVSSPLMNVSSEVMAKMKGHTLKAETMVVAVPIIELQLYVNPVIHYLVPPAIIYMIVERQPINRENLENDYRVIRKLLSHEFFHLENMEDEVFNNALQYCVQSRVIANSDELLVKGDDHKLQHLLKVPAWPAFQALLNCMDVMTEKVECTHKAVVKLIQQRLEPSGCHPYCLSLELTVACLNGLVATGALQKYKNEKDLSYRLVPDVMQRCRHLVNSVLPSFNVKFDGNNSVILDDKHVLSRL